MDTRHEQRDEAHQTKTSLLSPCHQATLLASLSDGVLIGSCSVCDEPVVRVNPCTGRQEWVEGHSPWTRRALRPVEDDRGEVGTRRATRPQRSKHDATL